MKELFTAALIAAAVTMGGIASLALIVWSPTIATPLVFFVMLTICLWAVSV